MDPSLARRRPDAVDLAVVATVAIAAAILLWLGRGLTFFADEWAVIGDRPVGIETFLRPFNEHWLGVTTLVHRTLVETIGIESYMPYLALLVGLHAIVVLEVYVLARRATWPVVALLVAIVVALFGSGFENLFWAMQIGFIGAIAMGLGALLLLEGPVRRGRVAGAVVLLTLGVMTSGFGLFMLAFVGLDVLLDPRRRRVVPFLAVPAAVYGVWYLALGRAGVGTHVDPFSLASVLAVPGFIVEGTAEALGSALGVGRFGGRIAVVALAGVVAWRLVTKRSIPTRAWACFGAIAVQYGVLALVRAQLDADATYFSRYSYLSGILALLGLVTLLGRPVVERPALRMAAVAVAGLAFVVSLGWNVRLLVYGRDLFAQRADLTRAMVELGLSDALPAGVSRDLSLVLVPSPVRLAAIVDTFGSPLDDALAGPVPPISETARAEAMRRAANPPTWLLEQPWLP